LDTSIAISPLLKLAKNSLIGVIAIWLKFAQKNSLHLGHNHANSIWKQLRAIGNEFLLTNYYQNLILLILELLPLTLQKNKKNVDEIDKSISTKLYETYPHFG